MSEPRNERAAGASSPETRRRLFAGWIAVAAAGAGVLLAVAILIAILR